MHSEIGEIKKEMGELKKGMQDMSQKIQKTEDKNLGTDTVVQALQEQNKALQASLISLECKVMERYLRLRGIPEENGENIFKLMIDNIARYLGEQPEDVSFNLESVYRVNSDFAVKNQLPRDVITKLGSKKIKNDILSKSFKEPLEIEGKTIRILRVAKKGGKILNY